MSIQQSAHLPVCARPHRDVIAAGNGVRVGMDRLEAKVPHQRCRHHGDRHLRVDVARLSQRPRSYPKQPPNAGMQNNGPSQGPAFPSINNFSGLHCALHMQLAEGLSVCRRSCRRPRESEMTQTPAQTQRQGTCAALRQRAGTGTGAALLPVPHRRSGPASINNHSHVRYTRHEKAAFRPGCTSAHLACTQGNLKPQQLQMQLPAYRLEVRCVLPQCWRAPKGIR